MPRAAASPRTVRPATWSRRSTLGRAATSAVTALAVLALAFTSVEARPSPGHVAFRSYGADDGLPLDVVVGIQDRAGFIWTASPNGLFRFDGHHFRRFSPDDGLPSSLVTDLAVAPDGALWGATSRGLFVQHGGRFVALGTEILPTDGMHLLGFDRQGRTWVTTTAGPFRQVAADRLEPLATWPGGEAYGLLVDDDGSLLIGRGARVVRKPADVDRFDDLGHDFVEPVTHLIRDARGRLWVRAGRRLWMQPRAGARFEDRTIADMVIGPTNVRLAIGATGNLLVPAADGLYTLDDDDVPARLPTNLAAEARNVKSAWVDREGSLWLTSLGLHHELGRGLWRTVSTADGLPASNVWTVTGLADGRIAVGTDQGVATIDGDRVTRISEEVAFSAIEHPAGVLWTVGEGLSRRDLARGTVAAFGVEAGLDRGSPTSLALTGDGTLWVGAERGALYRLIDGPSPRFEALLIPEADGGRVWGLAVDGERLLVATSRGLLARIGDRWLRFGQRDGLRDDGLTSVLVRRDREVCVTYLAPVGVSCGRIVDDRLQAVRHFDESNGLNSPVPYFLAEDREDRLWVGGALGVSLIGSDGVDHFTRGGGAPGDDCNAGAAWVAPDGEVWIGTSTGLGVFAAGRYAATTPPTVTIARGSLGGVDLDSDRWRGVRRVPQDRGTLDVEFAALTFLDPRRLEYQVMLVGFDDTWMTSEARTAHYHRLPPGDYRLLIRARHRGGTWGEPTAVEFVVGAAWWQTWWVRALGGVAIAGLIAAIVWWQSRRLLRRNLELEATVRDRTSELVRANERMTQVEKLSALGRLLAQLSHEINNPLNVIHNSLDPLEDYSNALRDAVVTARELCREPTARAALDDLWRRLDLDYVIADSDQAFSLTRHAVSRILVINAELKTFLRGEPTERALVALGPGLRATAAMFARSWPEIVVTCELPPLPAVMVNEGRIHQTVTNLLQNAADAMQGVGRIALTGELLSTQLVLRVADTGPGVPIAVRARIFEPFFSTKDIGKGLGLGLAICREIIKSHGGTLELDEAWTTGACFVISLPLPLAARRAA